jgi:undecaprenyl-diphosphatase
MAGEKDEVTGMNRAFRPGTDPVGGLGATKSLRSDRADDPSDPGSERPEGLGAGRSSGLRLGVMGMLACTLLVPFGLLAAVVVGGWAPLHQFDAAVTDSVYRYAVQHPGWVDVMLVWSWVFSPTSLRIAMLVLVIWLVRRRHAPRTALWVVVTMAAGGILAALLKLLVSRDRPELLDPVARAVGYAFPSGHAANAALTAGVLLVVLWPAVRERTGRRIALCAGVAAMALITGLSRIFLGVHWTSDVVAGWLFGIAVVAVTTLIFRGRLDGADRSGSLTAMPDDDLAESRGHGGR